MNFWKLSKTFSAMISEVEIGDILELNDSQIFTIIQVNLKWTHESIPTAWRLIDAFYVDSVLDK